MQIETNGYLKTSHLFFKSYQLDDTKLKYQNCNLVGGKRMSEFPPTFVFRPPHTTKQTGPHLSVPCFDTCVCKTLSLAGRLSLLGCARDLHPLEYDHAGRTKKKSQHMVDSFFLCHFFVIYFSSSPLSSTYSVGETP